MPATHEGTCQICLRVQKVIESRGALVMARHGFRRSWGHEHGDCYGSMRAPWEMSRLAACYYAEVMLVAAKAERVRFIERLAAGSVELTGWLTRNKLEPGTPGWEREMERKLTSAKADIDSIEVDIARMNRRISSWQPGELMPLEKKEAGNRD